MKNIKTTVSIVILTFMLLTMIPVINVSAATLSNSAGDYLDANSIERMVYDELRLGLENISGGKTTSTVITVTSALADLTWTAEELGLSSIVSGDTISDAARAAATDKFKETIDIARLIYRIHADCPYETYWYDALNGVSVAYNISATETSISIKDIAVSFTPMAEYAGSAAYTVDSAKIAAAQLAIENAKDIVAQNASLNDRDKLEAYYTKICELVSYDNNAPDGYSNSLQIINVFDGNPATNVVCEGYARAFKLLCDLSKFEGKVYCYTVNGTMDGGLGAGAHTWNIVSVNGKCTLADLTNSDTGTIGQNGHLFMASPTASANETTYSITVGSTNIIYAYDTLQKDLFCSGYPALTLATVSNDPVIAIAEISIASPVAGGSPSYVTVTSDPRYTAKVISWYDITMQKTMSAQDNFVEGYKYEATIEFVPANGFSFNDSSKFYVNDVDATVADGRPELRKVVFLATPQVRIAYDLTIIGGKATVNGAEVTKAYPGDRVVLIANDDTDSAAFQKWEVTSENVVLSNAFAAKDVFFYMPDRSVTIEAQFRTLTHTHKFNQTKADAAYLATAATCTEKATYYYSCECGESENKASHTFESGELAAHVFDKQVYEGCLATEATCTAAATYYYSCECGEIEKNADHTFISDEIAAHIESDWIVDKEAAPGVEGSKHTECTVCKATLNTEAIPALPIDDEPKNPGCGSAVAFATLLCALLPVAITVVKKND